MKSLDNSQDRLVSVRSWIRLLDWNDDLTTGGFIARKTPNWPFARMDEKDGERLEEVLFGKIEKITLDNACPLEEMPLDIGPYIFWNGLDWRFVNDSVLNTLSKVDKETWYVKAYYRKADR